MVSKLRCLFQVRESYQGTIKDQISRKASKWISSWTQMKHHNPRSKISTKTYWDHHQEGQGKNPTSTQVKVFWSLFIEIKLDKMVASSQCLWDQGSFLKKTTFIKEKFSIFYIIINIKEVARRRSILSSKYINVHIWIYQKCLFARKETNWLGLQTILHGRKGHIWISLKMRLWNMSKVLSLNQERKILKVLLSIWKGKL